MRRVVARGRQLLLFARDCWGRSAAGAGDDARASRILFVTKCKMCMLLFALALIQCMVTTVLGCKAAVWGEGGGTGARADSAPQPQRFHGFQLSHTSTDFTVTDVSHTRGPSKSVTQIETVVLFIRANCVNTSLHFAASNNS